MSNYETLYNLYDLTNVSAVRWTNTCYELGKHIKSSNIMNQKQTTKNRKFDNI